MMNLKKILLYLIVPFLIISCWPREMEETINLVINNGLDNRVVMLFFSNGIPSGEESIFINGKGEIFRDGDTATIVQIHEILQADSILIVFDNERIETHKLFYNEPPGNSLFDLSSYQRKGDTYTYTIEAKNHDYAQICNGPCFENW
ncbi:hypothetical protein J0654_10085 [Muricauda lutimaris]|uniref:Uncharacterized protein n=2 Tax=Flagellimonas profundi TaxID=2915620 RepID=A0ABS3FFQ5_9FLAO|nr:hypothetical protein [Allomuricauda profundi]